ncbi:MAG: hypothetical protein QXT86_08930 [Archaeoglobaceae archaeon]
MDYRSLYWFNRLLDFGLDNSDLFSEDVTFPEFLYPFLPAVYESVVSELSFFDNLPDEVIFESFVDEVSFSDDLNTFDATVIFEDLVSVFDVYDTLSFRIALSHSDSVSFGSFFMWQFYGSFRDSVTSDSVVYGSWQLYSNLVFGVRVFYQFYNKLFVLDVLRAYDAIIDYPSFQVDIFDVSHPSVSEELEYTDVLDVSYMYTPHLQTVFSFSDESNILLNAYLSDSFSFDVLFGSVFSERQLSNFDFFDVLVSGYIASFNEFVALEDKANFAYIGHFFGHLDLFDRVGLSIDTVLQDVLGLGFSVVPVSVFYSDFRDVLEYSGFLYELGKGLERFGSKVVFVFYDLGVVEGSYGSLDRVFSVYVFDKEVTGFSEIVTAVDGIYEFSEEEGEGTLVLSLESLGEQREKRLDRVFHGGRVKGLDVYVDGAWFSYNFNRDNSVIVGKGLIGEDIKLVLKGVTEVDWVKVRLDLLHRAKYR